MRSIRYTVGVRLGLGYALVLVLAIVSAVIAVQSLNATTQAYTSLITDRYFLIDHVTQIDVSMQGMFAAQHAVAAGDTTSESTVSSSEQAIQTAIGQMRPAITLPVNVQWMNQVAAALRQAQSVFAQEDAAVAAGHTKQVEALVAGPDHSLYTSMRKLISTFLSRQYGFRNAEEQATLATANRGIQLTEIFAVIAVLLGIVAAALTTRSISRRLRDVVQRTKEIADGNLQGQTMHIAGTDEVADLMQSSNDMSTQLRSLVSNIVGTSRQVEGSSGQLGAAATQSAQVVRQVAEAIGQVAASATAQTHHAEDAARAMGELQQSIQQISKGAGEQARQAGEASESATEVSREIEAATEVVQRVSTTASQAVDSARQGASATSQALGAVERIRSAVHVATGKVEQLGGHSERIGQITMTIGDIANQTSLLALNAAIEAARAGEQGKGFAVVAEEVRSLSDKAGRAAKEIEELVKSIQSGISDALSAAQSGTREVEQGTALSGQAGLALEEIVTALDQSSAGIQNIVQAMARIADGGREITHRISAVSAVTEENTAATELMAAAGDRVNGVIEQVAAVSEETAAAAEEVSAAAEEMNATIDEVNRSAQSMMRMSKELRDSLGRFRIEG
ncbi:MAG: methyl-accepting chemotaxis protein [Thermaerobacter sp.]|nr:methyl-accepting chemotaxis protein [Thermaerobacter sp.]